MKKSLSILLTVFMLGANLCVSGVSADSFDVTETYDVYGADVVPANDKIVVYPNESSEPRVLSSNEYGKECFRWSKLLIFNSEGKLIAAGGDLCAVEDGYYGSAQHSVTIPAGGFMVCFDGINPKSLRTCYDVAMEGAMLYNATMAVIYDVRGSYDKSAAKLTIQYNNPKAPSANAKKFLFVGNSSTYFSGTPIKFKGLALAAGVEVDVDYSTFGSAYWHEFADANHERGRFMRNKLNSKKYDYVVLQDAAGASFEDSVKSLDVIVPLVLKNGAAPLFYMRYSSTGDFAQRENTAMKYHKNYTRFGEMYNGKVSPVADAFIQSLIDNPKVELLADDKSHHSEAGAYLAACCWLYDYLGVDPRGNTYYANLPEDVAKALQNTAYKTCTEGYEYPEDLGERDTVDGVKYNNIALGCTYETTGSAYDPTTKWSDTDSATGKLLGKLTDGSFATAGDDSRIGAHRGASVSITVDLGNISKIARVRSDIFGNTWGLPSPKAASASVQFSSDGENYTDPADIKLGDVKNISNFERRDIVYDAPADTSARYIKLNFKVGEGYQCVWTSEIAVYGVKGTNTGDDTGDDDFVPGDVDGDGALTATDYAMAKRACLGNYTLTAEELKRADINANGTLDPIEYAMIKRHVLGNFTIPGAEGK